jgi:hypothetical protein
MRLAPAAALLAVGLLAGCPSDTNLTEADDPELTLDAPEPGEWLDALPVAASGEWTALSELEVNGVAATASGALSGTYTAEVPLERGINVIAASGVDADGDSRFVKNHVIAGEFENPLQPVASAATIRVNEEGLDVLLDAVGAQFTPDLIAEILETANPVYSGEFVEVGGSSLVQLDLVVEDFQFSWLDISAEPGDDVLDFSASLYTIDIDSTFEILFLENSFFDPIVVTLYADRVDITGQIAIGAYAGELDVVVLNSAVDMTGFFFDTDLIPSALEGYALSGLVESAIESRLGGIIEEEVAVLLSEQLSSFDFSFETELLDRAVVVEGAFADAGIDTAGLFIAVDVDADVAGDSGRPYRGYLTAPGSAATPDATADISLSLWDDMLNKILFEAWRSGMLDLSLSTADESLPPAVLLPLRADAGTITTEALLPPVIVEREGRLVAQLGEMNVTIDMEGSDLGTHLEVAVAVEVDLDLRVRNNEIQIVLGEPVLDLMVRDSDWGASNEATSNLLDEVLPIDLLLSVLGDLSFPLPDLLGLELAATTGRDTNGTHTSVRVDLTLAQ